MEGEKRQFDWVSSCLWMRLKYSPWLFLTWNCTFYILCMDAYLCVHVIVLAAPYLKVVFVFHATSRNEHKVVWWEQSSSVHICTRREFLPGCFLPAGMESVSNRNRVAPGFHNLQMSQVALSSLWLSRNGFFFVFKAGMNLANSGV